MELILTIAGVTAHVSIPAGALAAELAQSVYASFDVPAAPSLRFRVHPSPESAPSISDPAGDEVDCSVEAGRLAMSWRDGTAWFDWRSASGEMHLCPTLPAFTTALRTSLAFALPDFGAFLLHTCGVVRRGRAFLFFGASGSGKSTVAGLSSDPVLSDDTVAVRVGDGELRAYATPFRGNFREGQWPLPFDAPVAAAFHLVQAPRTFAEPLGPVEAFRRLSPGLMFDFPDPEHRGRLLALAMEFVARIPCFALHFTPTPDLWQTVDAVAL